MKIQILLFNGFDELDVIAPYEVFRMASQGGADLQVNLVTLDAAEEVVAAHGLKIRPQGVVDLNRLDLLLVPGGGWNDRAPQGVRAEVKRGEIPKLIAEAHQAGKTVAAVCTGAMLLAEAKILQGRPSITHHSALKDLRACGAQLIQARVVDDGDLITSGGVTSGIDLALWVVEKHFGSTLAEGVAKRLEYPRQGAVWKSPCS